MAGCAVAFLYAGEGCLGFFADCAHLGETSGAKAAPTGRINIDSRRWFVDVSTAS
jgi:hypothetical protein